MKNLSALLFVQICFIFMCLFFLVSCSEDNFINNNPEDIESNFTILNYSNTRIVETPSFSFKTIISGDLLSNKFEELQTRYFENEVLIADTLYSRHEYINGLLSKNYLSGQNIFNYQYNQNNFISGFTRTETSVIKYYEFEFISETVVYVNLYFEPYSNPNAQIISRVIVTLNDNDEVISAGFDYNLDGVATNLNIFNYEDGNMTSAVLFTGVSQTYEYSDILNTKNFVEVQTYGKILRNLMKADAYADGNLLVINQLGHSKYLSIQESQEYQFEVNNLGYYTTKTESYTAETNQEVTLIDAYEFSIN